jgi:fimbrial protein
MMTKEIFHRLTVLALMACIAPSVHAELRQSAGNVHFYGELVNAPCAVELRSQHQVVVMGQIRDVELNAPGVWAGTTAFQIRLEDCDTSVRTSASAAFSGVPDANDPSVFQIGSGRYPVKDVGLGIFDDKGVQVTPNTMPLTFDTLNDGVTVLHYTAKYRATGTEVIPGDASAAINFSVIYE